VWSGFGRAAQRVRNGACHRASPSGALVVVYGGGRRDLRPTGRTLKRNEAQEGVGRPHRQRCGSIPDPTTEQGLEAGAFDPPTSTDGAPATVCCERGRWSRGNGRKARAAVTRYGFRRGFLRRVRILHRGKASWLAGLRPDARCGNAVDPRIGSGMQQARDSQSGGNRRGGAKPRGRNGTSEGGTSGAEAQTGRLRRSGRFASMSMEGRQGRCRSTWPASQTKPRREGHFDQGDRFSFGEE
jgi:hypothetical protein